MCFVVPVFNHPNGIAQVCTELARFKYPILLVDDASDQPCRGVIDRLEKKFAWVYVLRFADNRGKGAAVCAGIAWAGEYGFSHALQIDADGQHDVDDIPKFVGASRHHPASVITGHRTADGISAARHYGRKLTDVLVWLQTLSTDIKDSMCGYRVYPVPATLALLEKHRVGQRMDFDTDILVRLVWRGVSVKQVQTAVIYRDHIPSHFKMLRDNLRLTRMHSFLVLGMLVRSPVILFRKLRNRRQQGNAGGHQADN